MKIVVLKFGGTSVGNLNRIKIVAKIISSYIKKRFKVIVVSSAMSGVTNDLIKKARELSSDFNKSEYDVLLSTGEQVSCSLIAGRLNYLGYKSQSFMSWQIPIVTSGPHGSSRINYINKNKILKYLKTGGTPIVTGFQGVNYSQRLTTLGRGGSDASAIMIAKFFNAEKCIIYTDVDGVYTTDPRLHSKARKINKISYDDMLEMSSTGAKVMQPTSIQDAKLHNVDIIVQSSFSKKKGTLITKQKKLSKHKIITGVTSTKNDSKITIIGVKDKPGIAATIFKPLWLNLINVDMVVQNISENGKKTDITFTINSDDLKKTLKLIKQNKKISYRKLIFDKNVAKVSIVGVGMITVPGITYRMFNALAKGKINIMVISTSEIKISVLIEKKLVKKAVKALHKEFDLNKEYNLD